MKKFIAPLIISILLLFHSFAYAIPTAPNATVALSEISDLGSNTLIVSPESDYTTIALAMAAATSGDTILVVEGTYAEAVVFSQDDLTLKSLGSASNTTITQATGSTVSFGTKSGCVLYGFTVALTAATAAGDETIYSDNDSATDFNTVENCIITATNNAANTFALTMLNIDDGGIKFLYNAMHITQSNDSACYAMQNTAAHISHYRDNNLTITQGTTGAHGSFGLHHNAGAGSTMYCMNNIIDFDAEHLTAGVAYVVYASAVENYVSGNEINAVTTGSGALYVLFTGGTDTAWYTGNQIYATTGDGDAEWANLTAGTTYASGNNISGDGASTTGGTIYESGNAINGVLSGGLVAGSVVETDLDGDNDPADNDLLGYDPTGTNFEWFSPDEVAAMFSAGALPADSVLGSDIDVTDFTLTDFTGEGNWKVHYTDGSGDMTELTTGAANTFFGGEGVESAPIWQTLVDADIPSSIDPDKIGTDGTANDKIEAGNINISSMDITVVDTIVWNAGGMIASGTCTDAAEATINSGPIVHSIICTDALTSIIDGSVEMPDGWNGGTVVFKLSHLQSAAETLILNSDIKVQCRGAGEAVNNTWGSAVAMDDGEVTGTNGLDILTSGAVTPNCTTSCLGGDVLYWKLIIHTDSTVTFATHNFLSMAMEFTRTLGD